jgi:hypothetical protein
MGWIFLESLVALVVLVAIVWWTMKPDRRTRDDPPKGKR